MGLSSKQVSSDGLDWTQTLLQAQKLELPKQPLVRRQRQQNPPQSEPLKCPLCDSINTKFCYYNNYNKSQPRHFCKACKRHWTKGGTLRDVPVGGGRKKKRLKTSKIIADTAAVSTTACTSTRSTSNSHIIYSLNSHMAETQQYQHNLPLTLSDQKSASEILYQAFVSPVSSALDQNSIQLDNNSFKTNNNNGVLLDSTLSLPQNHQGLHFSYSQPFQSSTIYEYTGEGMDDSTITNISSMASTSSTITLPWQVQNISNGMDATSYWNWDDIDNFASTDVNIPWDDPEIKP